jgi:hypothetical protein
LNVQFLNSDLEKATEHFSPEEFCIEDVFTSHDASFNWNRNVALFHCDVDWPYEEFRVTVSQNDL